MIRKFGLGCLFVLAFGNPVSAQDGSFGCFPKDKLPPYIAPLTHFGQRSDWSLDGREVYFVDKAGGEVWKVDIATKKTTQVTQKHFRPEGHGYYRVYALSNGDLFFTCGPERHNLYIQILRKGEDELPVSINERIDEGAAISRKDMKIVWTPDQKVVFSGRISNSYGKTTIVNKTQIIDNGSVVVDGHRYQGILEPQNFRPPLEQEIIWTQYGYTREGLFTSETMGYNLETADMVNYSKTPEQYDEPEGIFPDGEHTLVECDRHSQKGMKSIDVYKLKLDGTGSNFERMTYFNDVEGYKASNPVVRDDGKMIAFQAANAKAPAGVGCGIYLLDVELWRQMKGK
ncbi:MAG: hypothetical protein RIG77_04410 [Cyclobacteriaceae bacterium]